MHLDRAGREVERLRDLAVGAADRDVSHDPELAASKAAATDVRRGKSPETRVDALAERLQGTGRLGRERLRAEPPRARATR